MSASAAATFTAVTHEPPEFAACAICDRSILRGERVFSYVTGDGALARICPLCKPEAEGLGWIPEEVAARNPEAVSRPRRRGEALRERLGRAGERAGRGLAQAREAASATATAPARPPDPPRQAASLPSPPADAPPPEPEPPEPEPPEPEPPEPESPRTPERVCRLALEFFNATDQPRKVAGLMRSLGEPQVSVSADPASGEAHVTVAWELSWYRWRVEPTGEVRQVAKGSEVDELPAEAREWNASTIEEGRLRLDSAVPA